MDITLRNQVHEHSASTMTIRDPDVWAQMRAKRLQFDRFVLDLHRGCLLLDGKEIALRPKTFAVPAIPRRKFRPSRLEGRAVCRGVAEPRRHGRCAGAEHRRAATGVRRRRAAPDQDGSPPRLSIRVGRVGPCGRLIRPQPDGNAGPAASHDKHSIVGALSHVGHCARSSARDRVTRRHPQTFSRRRARVNSVGSRIRARLLTFAGGGVRPRRPSGMFAALAFVASARCRGRCGPIGVRTEIAQRPRTGDQSTKELPRSAQSAAIAILPFLNQSDDAAREYFADGLTQDIINALGRFSALTVMSWNAVLPTRASPQAPERSRAGLAVRYQVEGSVQPDRRPRARDRAGRQYGWSGALVCPFRRGARGSLCLAGQDHHCRSPGPWRSA